MATILIDDRERDKATGVGRHKRGRESIINYFKPIVEKYCTDGRMIAAEVKHIVVGDYAIMLHGGKYSKLVMAIERKTLTDLAGSIKGRLKGQIEAMKKLREKEGCALLFVLEAHSAFPKATTTYGNIPYGNLHAQLRHILIRDNIPWVLSKDQTHTAKMVCDFAADYVKLAERGDITIDFSQGVLGGIPEQLTKRKQDPDNIIILKMWCAVPGLHEHVSGILKQTHSLAELLTGEISVDEIAELTYASGTRVGYKRAEKMVKQATLTTTHVKIISEIPGVSKSAAERMLTEAIDGILGLYFMDEESIQNLQKTDKTKVGPALAKRIRKFMDTA